MTGPQLRLRTVKSGYRGGPRQLVDKPINATLKLKETHRPVHLSLRARCA